LLPSPPVASQSSQIGVGFRGFAFPDYWLFSAPPRLRGEIWISRCPDHPIFPPPAFFTSLLQTKELREIDPWVSLASRLRDPWVALG
jgi:hypothetical protein